MPPERRLRELIHRFVHAYASAQHAHRVLTEDVRFLGDADREAVVRQLMEAQHGAMVQALKSGKLDERIGVASADAQTRPPAVAKRAAEFGGDLISRRSLDEVILAHLAGR